MKLMKKSLEGSAWWRRTRIVYHELGFSSNDSHKKLYHIAIEYKQIAAVTREFIKKVAYEVLICEEFQILTWVYLNRLDAFHLTLII